jgi:hypothetical protein
MLGKPDAPSPSIGGLRGLRKSYLFDEATAIGSWPNWNPQTAEPFYVGLAYAPSR